MSGGIKAYTLDLGKPTTSNSLVNIFEPADEKEIVTVAEQKQFYAIWLKSLWFKVPSINLGRSLIIDVLNNFQIYFFALLHEMQKVESSISC